MNSRLNPGTHTHIHTHWCRGQLVDPLSSALSLVRCATATATATPRRVRRFLCPLLQFRKEGGRERMKGGAAAAEFSFPNLAVVPKVKAGNFSSAVMRGKEGGKEGKKEG